MTSDNSRHRLGLLAITALSLFAALYARLWFLQVVQHETLVAEAQRNTERPVITPGPRGRILDRNGVVLVDNQESITVAVDLQKYGELDASRQLALRKRLVHALNQGRSKEDRLTTLFLANRFRDKRFSPFRPVPVAEGITVEQEIFFREQADRFPGVVVEHQTVRRYPYGQLAAHLLGYVGPLSEPEYEAHKDDGGLKPYEKTDEIGKSGVELEYEKYLRGVPGRTVYEIDRSGRVVGEIQSEHRDPRPGNDVYLAIDAKVQYKAEQALQARLVAAESRRNPEPAGSVVVIDPTNGQVRAMASYPTYNPADLVGGISDSLWADLQGRQLDPDKVGKKLKDPDDKYLRDEDGKIIQGPTKLLNRAISGGYPAASTFKLASAYAALKNGIITPEDTIADGGYYRMCPGETKGCVKRNAGNKGHGMVNLQRALTVSSDVYFYRIGDISWKRAGSGELPDDALQKSIEELGYGAKTGIDLPSEGAGAVPTPKSEAALAPALFERDPEYYDNDIQNARDAAKWVGGFSADLAIGQKVTVTPLQTANAYAALANGGTLYQPQVLDRITNANSPTVVRQFAPRVIRQIDFGPARGDFLAGFAGVVGSGEGTAHTVFSGFPLSSWPVAGKTGTAQTGKDKYGYERPDNSLFVGWSLGDGHWLASAMLEKSGAGAQAAAPTVRMILEPIATGEIDSFQVPENGTIDAEAAAQASSSIGTAGSD